MRPSEEVLADLQANGPSTIRQVSERVRVLRPVDLSNTLRQLAAAGQVQVERQEGPDGRVTLVYRQA